MAEAAKDLARTFEITYVDSVGETFILIVMGRAESPVSPPV